MVSAGAGLSARRLVFAAQRAAARVFACAFCNSNAAIYLDFCGLNAVGGCYDYKVVDRSESSDMKTG